MNQSLSYEIDAVMNEAIAMGLAISVCTIQQPSGNVVPGGAPDGLYVDVAGMIGIPCMFSPNSSARIQATEVKAIEEITSYRLQHVWLTGWFPTIASNSQWRAVIDGENWDILGAEDDSQAKMTRLEVRIAQQ
jgi:hypothetical protein